MRIETKWIWMTLALLVLTHPLPTFADIRPEKVYVAESKKTQTYIRDGLIVGGDRAINDVVVKDIRRAKNEGFERIVIDLEGTQSGEIPQIQRPPYYQFAVTPEERRLVATFWGNPKLSFNSKKVVSSFKKSSVIHSISLFPKLEDNSWTFVFELKLDSVVEVFELSNPVRVIVDISSKKL